MPLDKNKAWILPPKNDEPVVAEFTYLRGVLFELNNDERNLIDLVNKDECYLLEFSPGSGIYLNTASVKENFIDGVDVFQENKISTSITLTGGLSSKCFCLKKKNGSFTEFFPLQYLILTLAGLKNKITPELKVKIKDYLGSTWEDIVPKLEDTLETRTPVGLRISFSDSKFNELFREANDLAHSDDHPVEDPEEN